MTDDKRAAFDKIDTDHDGFITADEFRTALQSASGKVSEENVAVIVKMADQNGDQRIDFDEYSKFVR